MKFKIAVIGYGTKETASTRFRFHQFSPLFQSLDCQLKVVYKRDYGSDEFWGVLEDADLIVNQKCLFGRSQSKAVLGMNKPVVFDFDDAIWTRPGRPYSYLTQLKVNRRFRFWCQRSDGVSVANQYLADEAAKHSESVQIIPMALDLDRWKPNVIPQESSRFTFGWNGAPNNIRLLESIDEPLNEVIGKNTQIALSIFSGVRPDLLTPFEYHPFEVEREIAFVQGLDMGLLPLEMDSYSKGKSPIKALQYLACGVPVMGVIHCGGRGFLTDKTCIEVKSSCDWIRALHGVLAEPLRLLEMKSEALSLVATHHSLKGVSDLAISFYRRFI